MTAPEEKQLAKIADDVTAIKIAIARMEEKFINRDEAHEKVDERLDNHEKRIINLEKRPGRWWDKLLGAGLVAAAGILVAWIFERFK